MARRIFDVTVAAMGLLVFGIPLIAIAIMLKALDGGPVLYRGQRIGRGGGAFRFYKFRTMRVGSTGSSVTAAGDSRISPIGWWLRRLKLDELPQLWNVLRGDLSIVGARPEPEEIVKFYDEGQRKLLGVKPGIAGMSQLVYPQEAEFLSRFEDPEQAYVEKLMPKKVAVDLEYEQRRTVWSDVLLVVELLLFIVRGKSRRMDETLGRMTVDRAK